MDDFRHDALPGDGNEDLAPGPHAGASDASGYGRPPRRRSRLRRALLLLVLVVLVGGALILAVLPSIISSNLSGWIEAALNDPNGKVELDKAAISWTGYQTIEGLRLLERLPDGTTRPIASLKRAEVRISLLDIARGSSSPVIVEIVEPVVHARRDADGTFNLERLLDMEKIDKVEKRDRERHRDGEEHRPDSGRETADRPATIRWNVGRDVIVRVRSGRLRYEDEALSTRSDIDAVDLDLSVRARSLNAELTARVVQPSSTNAPDGEVRWSASVEGLADQARVVDLLVKADAAVSSVDLRPFRALLEGAGVEPPAEPIDGSFSVELRERTLASELVLDADLLSLARSRLPEEVEFGEEARVSITGLVLDPSLEKFHGAVQLTGDLSYQGYRTTRITAKLEVDRGRILLRDVNADLNGGRAVAPLVRLDLEDEKPGFELEIALEDVEANYDMSKLLAYVVPFLSLKDRQSALSGRINASLKIRGRGFAEEDLAGSLEGDGLLRIRDGKFEGSRFFREVARVVGTDLDRVAFSELGSDFRISSGTVASENVFLVETNDKLRNLGLKGTTTLRGDLDFGVDLGALRETVGDKKIRKVLEGVSAVFGKDVAPIRLRGTLTSPRLAWEVRPGDQGGAARGILDSLFGR